MNQKTYNFDEIVDRENVESTKYGLYRDPPQILPFWVADMDFEPPREVTKAIVERAALPNYGYTFASDACFDHFIAWNQRRNHFEIERSAILSVGGIMCSLGHVLEALTQKHERILSFSPVYDVFHAVVREHQRDLVLSPMINTHQRYEIDWQDFETKIRSGVKLFLLCNPLNPSGLVWRRNDLERIAALCLENDVLVFSDDVYSDIIYPGHHYTPIASLSQEIKKQTITGMSPGKSFCISGLSTAFLIIPDDGLRRKVGGVMQAYHMFGNLFGFKAAETAYACGEQWLCEAAQYLSGTADLVQSFCNTNIPKLKVHMPEAAFLMWLDFSEFDLPQDKLMDRLYTQAHIRANDGTMYGEAGRGFIRFNIGTSRSRVQDGLERIAAAFP